MVDEYDLLTPQEGWHRVFDPADLNTLKPGQRHVMSITSYSKIELDPQNPSYVLSRGQIGLVTTRIDCEGIMSVDLTESGLENFQIALFGRSDSKAVPLLRLTSLTADFANVVHTPLDPSKPEITKSGTSLPIELKMLIRTGRDMYSSFKGQPVSKHRRDPLKLSTDRVRQFDRSAGKSYLEIISDQFNARFATAMQRMNDGEPRLWGVSLLDTHARDSTLQAPSRLM